MYAMQMLLTVLALNAGEPPITAVPPAPPAPAAAPLAAPADPVRALLANLETASDGLVTVTAQVHHEIIDTLLDEKVIRKGRLLYRIDPADGSRALAFAFEREIRDGRAFDDHVRYVIKQRWLVEVDPDDRTFIKRAIAGPDEDFDPLALGEGFFPLPIGQKADDVLARFHVELVDLPEDGALAKLRGDAEIDGLRLVPHADTPEAEEMRRIDLFYDRATKLPVGVHVIASDGDEQIARLTDLRRNADVAPDQLAWLDITPPDPKEWSIDIR